MTLVLLISLPCRQNSSVLGTRDRRPDAVVVRPPEFHPTFLLDRQAAAAGDWEHTVIKAGIVEDEAAAVGDAAGVADAARRAAVADLQCGAWVNCCAA